MIVKNYPHPTVQALHRVQRHIHRRRKEALADLG